MRLSTPVQMALALSVLASCGGDGKERQLAFLKELDPSICCGRAETGEVRIYNFALEELEIGNQTVLPEGASEEDQRNSEDFVQAVEDLLKRRLKTEGGDGVLQVTILEASVLRKTEEDLESAENQSTLDSYSNAIVDLAMTMAVIGTNGEVLKQADIALEPKLGEITGVRDLTAYGHFDIAASDVLFQLDGEIDKQVLLNFLPYLDPAKTNDDLKGLWNSDFFSL